MPNEHVNLRLRAQDQASRTIKGLQTQVGKLREQNKALTAQTRVQDKANKSVATSFGQFADQSFVVGVGLGQLAARASAAALSVVATGFGATTAVRQFIEYETALAEITTLFDSTPEKADAITASLQGISAQFGSDQIESARAYYQIVSSGAEAGAEANQVLNASIKAAVAGVTDVATTADAITTILNAYGLEGSRATEISDKLFSTVRGGKTTMEELSPAIGQVVAISARAGVSFDEVSAALAELTKNGISTRQSTTLLRSLMTSLLRPTAQAKKISEELGIEWNQSALQAKGLAQIIREVDQATAGNTEQLIKLLGGIEGYNAFAVLAQNNTEGFRASIDAAANSAGETDEAFAKMSETIGFQAGRVTETFGAITVAIGGNIARVTNLRQGLEDLADSMSNTAYAMGLLSAQSLNFDQQVTNIIKQFPNWKGQIQDINELNEDQIENINDLTDAIVSSGKTSEDVRREEAKRLKQISILKSVLARGEESLNLVTKIGLQITLNRAEKELEAYQQVLPLLEEKIGLVDDEREAIEAANQAKLDELRAEQQRNEFIRDTTVIISRLTAAYEPAETAASKYADESQRLFFLMAAGQLPFERFIQLLGYLEDEYQKTITGAKDFVDPLEKHEDLLSRIERQIRSNLSAYSVFTTDQRGLNAAFVDGAIGIWDYFLALEALNQTYDEALQKEVAPKFKEIKDYVDALVESTKNMSSSQERLNYINSQVRGLLSDMEQGLDGTAEEADKFAAVVELVNDLLEELGIKLGEGVGQVASFGDTLRDYFGDEFRSDLGQGLSRALVAGIAEGGDAARAEVRRTASSIGGDLGSIFGQAFGGPFGAALGQVLGEVVGDVVGQAINDVAEAIDNEFFSGRDRVTVGVNATSDLFSQLAAGDTVTAESGLRLTPQSRGAGDEGRQQAQELLDAFLAIDKKLIDLFKELGVAIDLTGVELEPDRDRTDLRPSSFHNPFGSVALDQVVGSDIEGAAFEFVQQWLEAVKDLIPENLRDDLLNAASLDEVFEILGGEVDEFVAGIQAAAQRMATLEDFAANLLDQLYPLEAIERERAESLGLLEEAYAEGLFTEEQYTDALAFLNAQFDSARAEVEGTSDVIAELSGATADLLDQLYPLEALERRHAESVARIDAELAAGLITQEQYDALLSHLNETLQDGKDALNETEEAVVEVIEAISEVSRETQSLLDELDPLAALERERTDSLARIKEELDAGVISQQEYEGLLGLINQRYAESVDEINGVLTELSDSTQDLLDELYPLVALEREHAEITDRLEAELAAGLITQEQYAALILYVNEAHREAVEELTKVEEVILELSDATRNLLDEIYPLEALERDHAEAVARLNQELADGLITEEQYADAIAYLDKQFEDSKDKIILASDEVKDAIEAIVSAEQERIDILNVEKEVISGALQAVNADLERLITASDEFDLILTQEFDLLETARNLVEFGDAGKSLTEQYRLARQSVLDLAQSESVTAQTVETLNLALVEQRELALELARAYYDVSRSVENLLGTFAETLEESLLTPEELQARRDKEIQTILSQIASAGTPEEIESLATRLNQLIGNSLNDLRIGERLIETGQGPTRDQAREDVLSELQGYGFNVEDIPASALEGLTDNRLERLQRDYNPQFASEFFANIFGQEFTGESAEAIRVAATEYAINVLNKTEEEAQEIIDAKLGDLGEEQLSLEEELVQVPQKLAELQEDLLEEQGKLTDRQKEIAEEIAASSEIMRNASEIALEAAKTQEATAGKQDIIIGNFGDDVGSFKDHVGTFGNVVATPLRVEVITREVEVNA